MRRLLFSNALWVCLMAVQHQERMDSRFRGKDRGAVGWIPAPRSRSGTSFAGKTGERRVRRAADNQNTPRMRGEAEDPQTRPAIIGIQRRGEKRVRNGGDTRDRGHTNFGRAGAGLGGAFPGRHRSNRLSGAQQHLESIGLTPRGQRRYGMPDGSETTLEVTGGR